MPYSYDIKAIMLSESDRRMGQHRRDSDPVKSGLARIFHEVVQTWIKLYGDIPFATQVAPKAVGEAQPAQATPSVETPAVVTPVEMDRQLRDALRPFVQEYQAAEVHTPDLVNNTWQGIWKVIGEKVDYTYQVPACDRTTEELAQLQKEDRAVLLLPSDIYTPEGLGRLGRAFPLTRSWTADLKEATKISHSSSEGGSIDIEMSLDAPHRTSKGYRQQELVDRITADGRQGMRLPTYLVGSEFSQLLTRQYFDINTWSRLPGSSCGGSLLSAVFGSDGRAVVNDFWSLQGQHPVLGGRSEGVKRA